MLLGNRVPTAMFDGDPGLGIYRLEPRLDLGDLLGRERCLPPGKGEADTRFPCDDATDLVFLINWMLSATSSSPETLPTIAIDASVFLCKEELSFDKKERFQERD
jgi:hypothetical protein